MAGSFPLCIAASRTSGRAPSATSTITGTRSSGECHAVASTFVEDEEKETERHKNVSEY
jgi:hypothetical protein